MSFYWMELMFHTILISGWMLEVQLEINKSTHTNTPTHKNIAKIDYDKESVMEGFRKIMLCKIMSQLFKIID